MADFELRVMVGKWFPLLHSCSSAGTRQEGAGGSAEQPEGWQVPVEMGNEPVWPSSGYCSIRKTKEREVLSKSPSCILESQPINKLLWGFLGYCPQRSSKKGSCQGIKQMQNMEKKPTKNPGGFLLISVNNPRGSISQTWAASHLCQKCGREQHYGKCWRLKEWKTIKMKAVMGISVGETVPGWKMRLSSGSIPVGQPQDRPGGARPEELQTLIVTSSLG